MENKKLSTGIIIFILILIVLLTCVTTLLVYTTINNKNTNIQISNNNQSLNNETTENNNLENTKFKINEKIKLNEKECDISINCTEKVEVIDIDSNPTTYLYNYDYDYIVKINENVITLHTTTFKFRNIDILTIADSITEKEYIVLKIETLGVGIDGLTRTNYYIYDEQGNEIGEIAHYESAAWIIDNNDREYSGNRFYSHESLYKIETFKYLSVDNSENTTNKDLYKKVEYTIENGIMKENVVKTYTDDEFEITGKS